ncbi:LPS-assembly protein LptD [Roseobacter sp. HKCCD7870]|uniref:LPS-assembly protein LptD n=1 Tax=Roseobacter sp. HKCCD7870 TaxID=3120343 RepID=UPI0030EF8ABA
MARERARHFWNTVRDFSAPLGLGVSLALSATWGLAQNADLAAPPELNLPSTLIADQIYFDQESQYYRASGNVQIFYGGIELRAPSLAYDVVSDRVLVDGPLYIIDQEGGQVFYGAFADMSTDLQDGVIVAARQLVDETLQVAAQEMIRSEGRYTEFPYVRASACEVCSENATPLWELRARRAVHDQETRSITYRDAQLRVAGTPVLYTPWLRTADPSVARANGFLAPTYSVNSRLGTRIGLPYFRMLGDSADITITPQISVAGGATAGGGVLRTLEGRYRQAFSNGYLELNGAFSRDDLTEKSLRAFLFSNGRAEFDNGIDLVFQTQSASDRSYISTYDFFADSRTSFGDDPVVFAQDRLNNFLRFARSSSDEVLSFDYTAFSPLRDQTYDYKASNRVLNAQWTFLRETGDFGDVTLNFGAQGDYNEFGDINPRRRDIDRMMANLIWDGMWQAGDILRIDADLGLFLDRYGIHDDVTLPDEQNSTSGFAATRLSWPFEFRASNGAQQTMTPSIGFLRFEAGQMTMPSIDGSIDMIDPFDYAQLGQYRRVNRDQVNQYDVTVADVDVTYRYALPSGYYFGGSVERDHIISSSNTGLRSGALYTLRLGRSMGPFQFSATSRYNPDFERVSDVLTFSQSLDNVTLDATYTKLERDEAIGNPDPVRRWSLGLTADLTEFIEARLGVTDDEYKSDASFITGRLSYDNLVDWRSSVGWTYDSDDNEFDTINFELGHTLDWGGQVYALYGLETDTVRRYGLGVQFDNECLRARAQVSRVDNRVTGLTPITQFSLDFELGSFGRGAGAQSRRCM